MVVKKAVKKAAKKTAAKTTAAKKAAIVAKAAVLAKQPSALSYSLTWSLRQRSQFLAALAENANVKASAAAAGKAANAAYGLRKREPAFAQAWEDAIEQALDLLEALIIARAGEGVEKDYFYQGETHGKFREYSDQLAMFLLRARRSEIYGKTTMNNDSPAPTTARAMAVKEILMARIAKLKDGKAPPEFLGTSVKKPDIK
jgi:hypothetical protein